MLPCQERTWTSRTAILSLSTSSVQIYFTGLELSFGPDWSLSQGERTGCGVLLCDDVTEVWGNSTSAEEDTDQADAKVSPRSISEMTIFKHAESNGAGGLGRLIAFLTSQQPTVIRVSDGIKVDGQLKAGRATLRLEFYKQEDCQAPYTCRVTQTDAQGREHVSSSRLQQQQQTSDGCGLQTDGARWSPAVALKLVSLMHEMDSKLSQVAHAADDSWQLRIQSLENRLEDKLASMENRLEDKIASIENRVESELDTVVNRLEGKVASLEKSLQDEIKVFQRQLSDKISDQMSLPLAEMSSEIKDNRSQLETVVKKTIDSKCIALKHDIKTIGDKLLAKVVSLNKDLQGSLNSSTTRMTSIETKLISLQNMNGKGQGWLVGLDEALSNISSTALDSAHLVEDQLASMNRDLQKKFQQLVSGVNNINNTATDCPDLRDVLAETQTNISDNLHTTIKDTLTLRSCRKNAICVLPHPSFPYPVVHPSKQSPLDFPHLCDTLTDGGGWIVIQRRSTGTVDFYRNWVDYKNGFGSMDDDFWLGNDKIHAITTSGTYELRVDLKYNGRSGFAHYSSFSISNEKSNYILHLGTYDGTTGDSLSVHKGRQFSTRDRDNDAHSSMNCAEQFTGAWWYVACHTSNLNGKWGAGSFKGSSWRAFSNSEPLSFTEMKIRNVDGS